MDKNVTMKRLLLASGLCLIMAQGSLAQTVDEVTVTGSYIKQSPEDAALPVDVVDAEDLFAQGSPSVVELVRNLGVSSGFDGETNQFQSNGLNGVANINLRGIGPGRNLVLLNGKRNPYAPIAISEQNQLFVDINTIPNVALDRVEILKDGAAATYGSDAISGVVNFITRDDFEGFEAIVSHKSIADSDGDLDVGFIAGHDFGKTNVMASVGYVERNELAIRDRDWAIQLRGANGNTQGYTGIPNPGAILRIPTIGDASTVPAGTAAYGGAVLDPEARNMTGTNHPTPGGFGTYNYAWFDNLIEDEERLNLFAKVTHEIDDTTEFSADLLYSDADVPNWKTSPSYPPQVLVDRNPATGRIIPSYHPGLVAMMDDYPSSYARYVDPTDEDYYGAGYDDPNCSVTGRTDTSCDAFLFFGRPFGASGPANEGPRERTTTRITLNWEGIVGDDINYNLSLMNGKSESSQKTNDTYAERWAVAMRGFGGPNCADSETTPGENGCEFYNPFSNAIRLADQPYATSTPNANYDASLANSAELKNWMEYGLGSDNEFSNTVLDAVFSGSTDRFDWAAGAQFRTESYKVSPYNDNDLNKNPCLTTAENERFRAAGAAYDSSIKQCDAGTTGDTSDDYAGAGMFMFLAGSIAFDEEQDIFGLFGELRTDLSDRLEAQFSVRYEDYGGDVGDSIDPKVALRYEVNDDVVARFSASTTFRGPSLNQLNGQFTTLSYVAPTGSFKAVDTIGTSDLDPEKAQTINAGLVFDRDDMFNDGDNLTFSADYWSISFDDPIIKESFNDILNAVCSADDCDENHPYYNRLSLGADRISGVQRIRTEMINGPTIDTSGFDIAANYEHDAFGAQLSYGLELNITSEYEVGAKGLISKYDALDKTNEAVPYLRPIVSQKGKLKFGYLRGEHNFNAILNFVGSYEDGAADAGSEGPAERDVAAHETLDLTYSLDLANMTDTDSSVWVSVYNALDEDPPLARLDMNYDPYTHSPFGRIIKVGVRHKF